MDSLAALQALAQTRDIWSDFDLEDLAHPRLFMGKRRRLVAESARNALEAVETLGLDARLLAKDRGGYLLDRASFIDERIDYLPSRAEQFFNKDALKEVRHSELLPDCYCSSAVRERFYELSLEDDRKKKGRRLWLDFDALEHMANSASVHPWRTDLSQRAHYLRAQNCLMRALGPCSFDPLEVAAFVCDSNNWYEAHGFSWMKGRFLPRLVGALQLLCDSSGANLVGLTRDFIEKWSTYEREVQRVYCLWKGWKGPRASDVAQRDFGLDMLAAYARLFEACELVSPVIERADTVIAAFDRIAGGRASSPVFGGSFCPQLDPVAREEHTRRSVQSAAARAARDEARFSDHFYSSSVGYIEEDPYYAIGTLDDYFHNRWRYSSDFFDTTPPWERSSYPTSSDSKTR